MGSNRPVCKLLSILRRPWGVRRINCSMKIIRIAAIFGSLNWRSCYPAVLRLNGSFCSKSSLQSSAVLRRRQIVDWTTRKKMRSSAFCRCLSFLYCFSEYNRRKPLIIRGACQVGKTWLMKEFGAQEYKPSITGITQ